MTCRSTLTHRDLPTGCSYTVPNFYKKHINLTQTNIKLAIRTLNKGGPNSVFKNYINFRCKKRTPKLASCVLSYQQPFPSVCWCFFARARTFQRVHSLESYSRTSGGSNDHRQCRDTNCTTRTILSVCWCKSPVFSKHTTLTHSSHSSLSHSFREKLVVGLFGLSFSFSFGQFPLFRCVQFLATLLELLDSLRRLWAAKPAHMDRICFFRSRWHPAGPPRWVSGGYSGFPWLRRCNAL